MFNWLKKQDDPVTEASPQVAETPERRTAQRENTYANIVAVSEHGSYKRRGIVLDLSDTGARVRLEAGDTLVDGMTVKIARYGIARKAKTRWKTRMDVGLEFVD